MKRFFLAMAALAAFVAIVHAQVVTTKSFPEGAQTNNLVASTTFTTGSANVSLTGVTGKWTYLCGFVITSSGTTTATGVTATVAGTVTTNMNYNYAFVSSGQGILGVAFPGCITGSTLGGSIGIFIPAGGTGTTGAVTLWGYTN